MTEDTGRVGSAETGSRASMEPSCTVSTLTGFDPAREALFTLDLIREAVAEYRGAPFRSADWLAMQVMDALKSHRAVASGIEAATAGETSTQIEGSTEGESPTSQSEGTPNGGIHEG